MHGYELRTQDDGSVALIEFTPTVIATFWDRSHAERYFGILCEFEVADASRPIFYPDHQTASAEQPGTSDIAEGEPLDVGPNTLTIGPEMFTAMTAMVEALQTPAAETDITDEPRNASAAAVETVTAPTASVDTPPSTKTKPPIARTSPQPFNEPSEEEWEDAFKALDRGEKLKVLSDDLRVNPYKLQGKFGAWKKKRKPQEPAPEDLEDCRLCGTPFRATATGPDLCARCSRG
jgi:hypothetical protein